MLHNPLQMVFENLFLWRNSLSFFLELTLFSSVLFLNTHASKKKKKIDIFDDAKILVFS